MKRLLVLLIPAALTLPGFLVAARSSNSLGTASTASAVKRRRRS